MHVLPTLMLLSERTIHPHGHTSVASVLLCRSLPDTEEWLIGASSMNVCASGPTSEVVVWLTTSGRGVKVVLWNKVPLMPFRWKWSARVVLLLLNANQACRWEGMVILLMTSYHVTNARTWSLGLHLLLLRVGVRWHGIVIINLGVSLSCSGEAR